MLASLGASTNGIAPTSDGTRIFYQNTNRVNDEFNYTVSDGFGGTGTGTVRVVVSPFLAGQNASVSVGTGAATVDFAGIPGYTYGVQRSTDLVNWTMLLTTNAPADGAFEVTDPAPPQPTAFYRLVWNP